MTNGNKLKSFEPFRYIDGHLSYIDFFRRHESNTVAPKLPIQILGPNSLVIHLQIWLSH